mgnify:CR=1 FL=1
MDGKKIVVEKCLEMYKWLWEQLVVVRKGNGPMVKGWGWRLRDPGLIHNAGSPCLSGRGVPFILAWSMQNGRKNTRDSLCVLKQLLQITKHLCLLYTARSRVLSSVGGSTCTLERISLSVLRTILWILFTHMQTFFILQKWILTFVTFEFLTGPIQGEFHVLPGR